MEEKQKVEIWKAEKRPPAAADIGGQRSEVSRSAATKNEELRTRNLKLIILFVCLIK
jgi:hypothetical protein